MRPGFVPPLVEKMKVSMAMLDWEQSVDMMNRWVTWWEMTIFEKAEDGHCMMRELLVLGWRMN